jgi:Ni,Fe-hydrogenase III large subunit
MTREDIPLASLVNGGSIGLESIPSFAPEDFAGLLRSALGLGFRISSYFGAAGDHSAPELYALLADDERNKLYVGRTRAVKGGFPSIARDCPQAQLFEREIAEQFGLVPEGHPWLKPLRYARSRSFARGRDAWGRSSDEPILPAVGGPAASARGLPDFYRVEGESVHEVAVGPVHAGVIEPGHFRFQCHGERVFHLEIALGYQHRGVEEAMPGGPDKRSIHYAETASGDATIAHATSYCRLVEALASLHAPARAQALGAIALELERLACHIGDLGALAGDVGFLPTASYCGRIRGDFLNMTALLCGNRFGRGLIVPGGLGYDAEEGRIAELARRLAAGERDASVAIGLLFDTQSVLARFEDTGRLGREAALELGVVGPAARASGLSRDLRFDQPSGMYRLAQIPVSTYDSGDVLGRAFVRKLEIGQSIAFIREQLECIPSGPARAEAKDGSSPALARNAFAAALEEGWRGEVCHVALTDGKGAFSRYKITDPSFHNWPALAHVLRDQEISDFPICNKSFNLSYCGHDL